MSHVDLCSGRHHVCVTLRVDGKPFRSRVLDLRRNYRPLSKEFAYRVVAADPSTAGLPWDLDAGVDPETEGGSILLRAVSRRNCRNGDTVLGTMTVPAANFSWIAAGLAADAGVEGEYDYSLAIPAAQGDMPAGHGAENDDFEIIAQPDPELNLPDGFRTGMPVRRRRQISPAEHKWLTCVFQDRALDAFVGAAAKEENTEKSWAGVGFVHVDRGACRTVIEEIVEIPGEAGRTWITTRGRDWGQLHRKIGADRLVAYLHLHPRLQDDRGLPPAPSTNDAVVAWNVDLGSANPCVFPIALFGADPTALDGDLAAFGFVGGLLQRIPVEVVT